jgi:DNA-binding NtrC family response regulator
MAEEVKANVLLVDDEEKFLEVFSQRLQGRGLKVDKATSGEDAITRSKAKDFDAIVLDLSMPGMGGIEALKAMKNANPDLQIIILTGHGTLQAGIEAMKVGAMDFMEKPVDINKLMEKISEAKNKKVVLVDKKHGEHIKEIMQTKSW